MLPDANRRLSAIDVLSPLQWLLFAALGVGLLFALFKAPLALIIALNAFVTLYVLLVIAHRIQLVIVGAFAGRRSADTHSLQDNDLPVVTILLPLYRDADSLVSIASAIDALDYPVDKMDVKLLLEENDKETIGEARRLGLDRRFECIEVPSGSPQTKPRACNFGMHLARGELIVIYDAEDQPEADQLRKAALAFHEAGDDLACVQARLNYYNASENWLTRMFTLEYSLWFDWFLPALEKLRIPIPLGGTSNFFRTETLVAVGGWDAYNVTEDADLGLRLSKLGYRVGILDSTTFEEANCRMSNWVRQRSRWMKGYLQTWLVHMRRPGEFLSTTGWPGLLSMQLFIAGNFFSALVNPLLWFVFVAWLLSSSPAISAVFPEPLLSLNIFALIVGNLFFILLAVVAPLKRGWWGLAIFGLTAPAYWALSSLAAYKALWQIFFRPHFWEKTDHVISEIAIEKREEAVRAFVARMDWPDA